MSALAELRYHLRDRAEHHLRLAAMEELRGRHPEGTAPAYQEPGAVLWRRVFVPLYRRVPWEVKLRTMHALGMTAEHSGWTPPPRHGREPWRPPGSSSQGPRGPAGRGVRSV